MKPTKKPGRPPIDDEQESVPIYLRLSASDYQTLDGRAKQSRCSVQEIIRRDLRSRPELKYRK